MKRFVTIIITLAIVLSLFSGVVSAETIVYITKSGSKYHNDGCQHLSKSKISITLSEAIKRGYTPCADCHAPTSEPVHTHSWDGGKVTTAATCTTAGVRTYTCSGCGQTKTEPIPATGVHTWNNGQITTAATCSTTGVRTYTCTVCWQTKTESIPATGVHTWDGGQITTAATCCRTGICTYTCTGCRQTKTETIPIDPNAHAWNCQSVYVEPKDGIHGYGFFACVDCGMTKEDEVCPSTCFSDVKNDWSHEGIDYAVTNEITAGTDATHFSPSAPCTRGQVVTFLWRAAGKPEPVSSFHSFTDVRETGYYYKAMLWALENGITAGISNTTFAPNRPCTRGQVVTFLWRAKGCPEPSSVVHSFTDIKDTGFYYKAMLWAVENGITAGTSRTTFAPYNTCTRAQVVTFLLRSTLK